MTTGRVPGTLLGTLPASVNRSVKRLAIPIGIANPEKPNSLSDSHSTRRNAQMHPSNLHAIATCWSLRRAWSHLQDQNPDGLRSTIYGNRTGSGTPADPVPAATTHYTRTAELVREQVASAWWLTTSALRNTPMPTGPALAVLCRALADVDPATAHEAGRYLDRADQTARRALALDTDHRPIPGSPRCPACGVPMLRSRTSNPDSAQWPVICAAGCTCNGPACPCGMAIRQKRTPHIWPATWARDTLNLDTAKVEATAA